MRCVSVSGMAMLALVACTAGASADSGAQPPERISSVTEKGQVKVDEHGLTLRSVDDLVNFQLGGRLQMDFGTGGSPAIPDAVPESFRIRRLWIEPRLTIDKNLFFNLQYDPTYAPRPVKNLLMSYKGLGPFTVTLGNFKEPFSLDWVTSSNDTTFMERSLAFAFVPGRSTGMALGTHGEKWTFAMGVFGGNINSSVFHEGVAVTARATYAPVLAPSEVVHLGLSASYQWLDQVSGETSFATRPESYLFTTPLVNTGAISGARAIGRLGGELAWAKGPFHAQLEYILTRVERSTADPVTFHGGYAQAAWVINGSSPKYALESDIATTIGVFKRVQPEPDQRVSRGGTGVFEVAARYSAIDLTSANVLGGFQQDLTLGLNWYPEPFIRVMANYVHAWADPAAHGISGLPTQADIAQVRVQFAF